MSKPTKVSAFGSEIYTARILRGDIVATRAAPGVVSLKAGKPVTLPRPLEPRAERDVEDDIGVAEEDGEDAVIEYPDPATVG